MTTLLCFLSSTVCLLGVSSQLSAEEHGYLEGACGSVYISGETVSALDSWCSSQEICLGTELREHRDVHVDDHGLLVVTHPDCPSTDFSEAMAIVVFDDMDDTGCPKELIAERDPIDRPKGRCLGIKPVH